MSDDPITPQAPNAKPADLAPAQPARSGQMPARCWVEIRLDRLIRNVAAIRDGVGPGVRMISVVKADGYGLGASRLASALASAGVDFFAVANVDEAIRLKQSVPASPILLLSATAPAEEAHAIQEGFVLTLSTEEERQRLEKTAENLKRDVRIHVKLDTGMGRLGQWHEQAAPLLHAAARSSRLLLEGIYTHFASGAEDRQFTETQRLRFCQNIQAVPGAPDRLLLHADNSGGTETFPGKPFNAIRIGLLQLGYSAIPGKSRFAVEPVASLHSVVTVCKMLPEGTSISYGGTHVLRRPTRVAIIAAGYADGVPRACGNRGCVLIRGKRCPILGHVTMDTTVVDITDAGGVEAGERATFFGCQEAGGEIPLHEFSAWAGSIPWESLCRLSPRVRRVYNNG